MDLNHGYGCTVCGIAIMSNTAAIDHEWLRWYRVIYRSPHEFSVTEPRRFAGDKSAPVPLDAPERLIYVHEGRSPRRIPIMAEPASCGWHGYILHNACWKLLLNASEPVGFSIAKLVRMCESHNVAEPYCCVYWGHTYEELVGLSGRTCVSWPNCFVHFPSILTYPYNDPFKIPDLREDLLKSEDDSHIFANASLESSFYIQAGHTDRRKDVFSILPWELREIIAKFSWTADALNLRLASRSFVQIYWSEAFWLSRFARGSRKFCIFEAKGIRDVKTLQRIHRATSASRVFSGKIPALMMRYRIWPLVEELIRTAQTEFKADESKPDSQSSKHTDWRRVGGHEDLHNGGTDWTPMRKPGCRSFAEIILVIPKHLRGIGITVVKLRYVYYISGIRFIAHDGQVKAAGYVSGSSEVYLPIASFCGFVVAMGSCGLKAVKLVDQEGSYTNWIGDPRRCPKSMRLVSHTTVKQVKITTDGYKIIALSIPELLASGTKLTTSHSSSIRQNALWYPGIPPLVDSMHECFFKEQDQPTDGYAPLSYIYFGRRRGNRYANIDTLGLMSFRDINIRVTAMKRLFSKSCERITLVSVGRPSSEISERRLVGSVRISTSHGREISVLNGEDCIDWYDLEIEEGTVITGFYGHYFHTKDFINLGVMTEKLKDQEYKYLVVGREKVIGLMKKIRKGRSSVKEFMRRL